MDVAKPQNSDAEVEEELNHLVTYRISDLRQRWRELFKNQPPTAFGPDLLRRSIAYRIQENTYGRLPASTRRTLDQLIKLIRNKPTGRIELPRRIKTGSVLVREWKGTTHRVTVVDRGFIYEDETYPSLSEIACKITGTKWNGPRFFGLRRTCVSKTSSDDKGGYHFPIRRSKQEVRRSQASGVVR
jgi:hypothetical protein